MISSLGGEGGLHLLQDHPHTRNLLYSARSVGGTDEMTGTSCSAKLIYNVTGKHLEILH